MTTDERLDRLERQNRWLRSGLASLVVVMVVGGLLGFASQDTVPDVVKAKEFQTVDENGNVLVKIGGRTAVGSTWGYIETMTPDAQKLVSIETTGSFDSAHRVGAINTFHNEGQPLVSIGAVVGGYGAATAGGIKTFTSTHLAPITSIQATPDGGGNFVAFQKVKGERNGAIASVGVFRGAGLITAQGRKLGAMVRIGANQDGEAYISAWGRVSPSTAQPLVVISSKDGSGIVGVYDRSDHEDLASLVVPMTGPTKEPWQSILRGTPEEQSE